MRIGDRRASAKLDDTAADKQRVAAIGVAKLTANNYRGSHSGESGAIFRHA